MIRAWLRLVSIRVKLTGFVCFVVVAVVLGQAAQNMAAEALRVQTEVSLRARLVLISVASAVGSLWTEERVPELEPFARTLARELDVTSLLLVDAAGDTLGRHGHPLEPDVVERVRSLGLSTLPASILELYRGPVELLVASPIQRGSQIRGFLLCAFASAAPAERLRQIARRTALSALFWGALGGAAALWVTRRFTRPLGQLAEDLQGSPGTYRIPASGPADGEIGLVQRRLADLAARADAQHRRVLELNEALKHQIEVVTARAERLAALRRAILDSVRDAIVVVQEDGRVSAANGAAEAIFGGDVASGDLPLYERLAEPERVRGALRRSASLGRPVMLSIESLPAAEGEPPTLLRARATPLHGSDGGEEGVVLVAEDLSERRALEEQMLRSERLAALGTLTAGLTHQIGNYLHALKGVADLLKGSVETPGARSDVEQISRAVRDAAALMKRVQMLARKRAHTISVIRVQDVVDGAVDLVSTQARHQGVTLEVQAPADPILTRGDPYLLQQAVLNIAVNAIQAMPGGGTLEISTASGAAGGVAITFHDTGPGMDPAVAEHIFDPFFTTKPEGEGTGLGLPLALHVVELHGGAIDVGSTEGRGATFRILLPRNPGEPEHDGGEA